jgi:hypothetical protein
MTISLSHSTQMGEEAIDRPLLGVDKDSSFKAFELPKRV